MSWKIVYGNDWIYYLFEKGKEVSVSEEFYVENIDWDIVFNCYNVCINSGVFGKGKGGVLFINIKDLVVCMIVL